MVDRILISQVTGQVAYALPPKLLVSQVTGQVAYTLPSKIKISQVVGQVAYAHSDIPSGTVDPYYKIPVILATISTESGEIRRATEFYVDSAGTPYYPGLMFPTYSGELKDLFTGVEQSGSVTLQMSLDSALSVLIAAQDLRSRWVSLYSYDPVTGERTGDDIDFRGKIDSYKYDDVFLWLTVSVKADDIFDKLLPPDVVTADFPFTETAQDLGWPVSLPIGICRKIPLANIQNDTVNDYYDYLVGYAGITEITTVYRENVIVPSSEYTWLNNTTYSGFSVLRFTVEQKDFSGNFHKLFADVTGFTWESTGPTGESATRHILDALYMLLVNNHLMADSYGADETDFASALVALEGSGTAYVDNKYWVDINIGGEQRRAGDWLNDILAYTPIRLSRKYNGKWTVAVSGIKTPSFYLGMNDGFYDNCIVGEREMKSTSSSMRNVKVQYNFDEDDKGDFYYQIQAPANTNFGVDKTIQLKTVNADITAKTILSLIVNTEIYSNNRPWVPLECGPLLRNGKPGDVVRLYSVYPATYQDYIIHSINKNYSEKFDLECREYSDNIYSALTIDDPTTPDRDNTTVNGPNTIVGTYTHADATETAIELSPQDIAGYDIVGMFNGVQPSATYVFMRFKVVRPFTLPIDLTGSYVWSETAATASNVLTLKKNSTTIGTATFAVSGTSATLSFTTVISFAVGDIFYMYGPATADATLANLGWTFVAVKDKT